MKSKRPVRFEYGKNDDGQFYWHLKAANGEIFAQGEGYKRRAGVLKVFLALFNTKVIPIMTYLNDGDKRKPRCEKAKCGGKCGKKPKHFEGKLNRSFP